MKPPPTVKYKPGTEHELAALTAEISRLVREEPQNLAALKAAVASRNALIVMGGDGWNVAQEADEVTTEN